MSTVVVNHIITEARFIVLLLSIIHLLTVHVFHEGLDMQVPFIFPVSTPNKNVFTVLNWYQIRSINTDQIYSVTIITYIGLVVRYNFSCADIQS